MSIFKRMPSSHTKPLTIATKKIVALPVLIMIKMLSNTLLSDK
jgi:hypothetical protein